MYVFLQEHALYTHVLIARLLRRHLTFEYFIGEPMIPPGLLQCYSIGSVTK